MLAAHLSANQLASAQLVMSANENGGYLLLAFNVISLWPGGGVMWRQWRWHVQAAAKWLSC